jgi:hypothetical protein
VISRLRCDYLDAQRLADQRLAEGRSVCIGMLAVGVIDLGLLVDCRTSKPILVLIGTANQ